MIKNIEQLGAGIYADAKRSDAAHGLRYTNLNAHLLAMAEQGDFEDGLIREDLLAQGVSPVRQLLAHSGVRLGGLRASSCGAFFRQASDYVPGADVLLPALAQEMFESALGLQANDLSFQTRPGVAGDTVYATEIRPFVDQRLQIPENTVSVEDLVSVTFGIDGDSYKTAQVKQNQRGPQNEFGRVAEAAEFPLYSITTSDRIVRVYKYGGRINWSYEVARRMRINQLQILLTELAFAEDVRRRKAALEVAVNGDGNGNGVMLSPTVPAAYSIQNIDEFGMDTAYNSSLGLNMYAGDLTEVKNVRALRYNPNGQVVLNPDQLAMYSAMYQMPDGSPLKLSPKGSILDGSKLLLGWNTARGLEQVIENGSQIEETEKIIANQTNQMVMSINIGYGKPYDNSFQALSHA